MEGNHLRIYLNMVLKHHLRPYVSKKIILLNQTPEHYSLGQEDCYN